MGSTLVLASASPRRADLLRQLGLTVTQQPANVDEQVLAGEAPVDYVRRVARAKAAAVASGRADAPVIVLGADTAVVVDGAILGKPRSRVDAEGMLARLSGRSHRVLTAVAVVARCTTLDVLSETRVWLRPISPHERQAYAASDEPADKAGGYAIQGLGAVFVERIEGSYSGVMGLPLFETATLLRRVGIDPLGGAGEAQ